MKKIIVFFAVILCAGCSAHRLETGAGAGTSTDAGAAGKVNPDVVYSFNLAEKSEPKASKILYDYVLDELKMSPAQAEDFASITPQRASAFEFDLNNDGLNEVIGVVYSTYYYGKAGYSLFILGKHDGVFKDLARINFDPALPLKILDSSHFGYADIRYGAPIIKIDKTAPDIYSAIQIAGKGSYGAIFDGREYANPAQTENFYGALRL